MTKKGESGPKILFFFNLSKNLVIYFFWVYSLRKVYIICCVPAQIPYLGKIWFLKDSWPIRMSNFCINHVSKAKSWKNLIFFYIYTNSWKLVESKYFQWALSKVGVASLVSVFTFLSMICPSGEYLNILESQIF